MKKKIVTKADLIVISVALVMSLCGLYMYVKTYQSAKRDIVDEHMEHLLDSAYAADKNIDMILTRGREELQYTVENLAEEEQAYLESGDTAGMLEKMENCPALRSGLAEVVCAIDGEQPVACTGEEDVSRFHFINPCEEGEISLCKSENGKLYLALSVQSGADRNGLIYAELLNLADFYRKVQRTEAQEGYWMVLYDEDCDLFLQDDPSQVFARTMSQDEANRRKDALSILVESDQKEEIITRTYTYKNAPSRNAEECLIAAIPKGLTQNRSFAVGVALEKAKYLETINRVMYDSVSSFMLLLLGLSIFIYLTINGRNKSRAYQREILDLKGQTENVKELSHLQRLELLGTLTGGIAHEINNMLTPIMGYSIMTMEKLPEGNEELVDNLAEIYEASEKAKKLISRLSALSRKTDESKYQFFSPDEMVRNVCEVTRPSQPLTVKLEYNLNCPSKCLLADRMQIEQVLLNLVVNAFQAMEEKGGTLFISTELTDKVIFTLRDTGPGIPDETLKHIFDPFFTTKEAGKGTGLGLAIVDHIIQAHNGTIRAASRVGEGTTFTIELPGGSGAVITVNTD